LNSGTESSSEELSSSSYSGSESNHGSDNKRYGRVNRVVFDKNSDEYKKRRERNNKAVERSRKKTKMLEQQSLEQMINLKKENEMLEDKVKTLSKELQFLKELILSMAGKDIVGQHSDEHFTPLNNGNSFNNDDQKVPFNYDMN